jgi:hypothetical protein
MEKWEGKAEAVETAVPHSEMGRHVLGSKSRAVWLESGE